VEWNTLDVKCAAEYSQTVRLPILSTMKQFVAIFTFATLTVLTSGCQFSTSYAVANLSDRELEVQYELKPSGMLPEENVKKPYVLNIDEFNSGNLQWRALPPDKFAVDEQKGIIRAVIQPNQVLEVESEDSVGVENEPERHFDIKKLVLTGLGGSATYEGNDIYKQFTKEEKCWVSLGCTVFVIYYH